MWYPLRLRVSSTTLATVVRGGDVFSLSPFLLDVDGLRRLGCYGFLDIGTQLFCLGCLYCQVGGGGFGLGLGAFG